MCRVASKSLIVLDNHTSKEHTSVVSHLNSTMESSEGSDLGSRVKDFNEKKVDIEGGKRINAKTMSEIQKDTARVYEKQMSLPELISTYWDNVMKDLSEHKKNNHDLEDKDGLEDMDISMFSENLNEVIQLTGTVKQNLEIFNNYIFYSDLYDCLEDIHRTNQYYSSCIQTREPDVSKYSFACFLEHIFTFLKGLNEALISSDISMITYFTEDLDELYYQSYMEYYYRESESQDEMDYESEFY